MFLVFTDLDGTLLDHDTYSWEPARPAIRRLIEEQIPWIFVTSKTRVETEAWRIETGNRHPFIVENGGAAVIPRGYFSTSVAGAVLRSGYEILEWGTPYAKLVVELHQASELSRCRVRGFHDMTVEEVGSACGLSAELAHLAKQREYDEPFMVIEQERAHRLVEAIVSRGLRCTKGGRLWHITGANDKGTAVQALARLYAQEGSPTTIGLGDGLNDVPLLQQVDVPVIIRSAQSNELICLVPGATVTAKRGPAGWAEALRRIIPEPANDLHERD